MFFLFAILYNSLAVQVKTSLSGETNIEANPGPAQKSQNKSFSICHWNLLMVIPKYHCLKLILQPIYNLFIEIYLDSTIKSDNDNLEILGYNLVRSDHPSNNKRLHIL